MLFRVAENKDLEKVFNIYCKAIEEMDKHNIYQWDELYPDKEILKEDIEKGELYIGEIEGEIACAFVINSECDEAYEKAGYKKVGNAHWRKGEFYLMEKRI